MSFDVANLRQRVLSALVLIPVVLAAVYFGGWAYGALVIIFAGVGFYEWLRLIDPAMDRKLVFFALALFAACMITAICKNFSCGLELGAVATLLLFGIAKWRGVKSPALIALGIPYMAGSGIVLLYLRALPDGLSLVCYLLAVVWGVDSGAYAAGRLIGGPKLAPRISPSKTWAGLAGGMVLAAVFGYGVTVAMKGSRPDIAFALAVLLALVAQMGDLFKSFFKRRAGVKDSGYLIPGHGGVLDRIDGLAAAALFLALFEALTQAKLAWW
jgi:phosphatidate cytidylyltransferase